MSDQKQKDFNSLIEELKSIEPDPSIKGSMVVATAIQNLRLMAKMERLAFLLYRQEGFDESQALYMAATKFKDLKKKALVVCYK